MTAFVALHNLHLYNARAKLRSAWQTSIFDATVHRPAVGSGVFSAGGKHKTVLRLLMAQTVLSVVLAMLFWGIDGSIAGYSALLGGLTCVVPNAFMALRLAAPRRDPGASGLVRAAYIGEIGKVALTVLMFSMVFTLVRPLAAGALFAGFIGAQLVTLPGLLMRDSAQVAVKSNKNGK